MTAVKLNLYKENLIKKRTEQLKKDFIFLEGCAKFSNAHEFEVALNIAKKFHEGQFRKSGEPYLSHVIDVTIELLNRGVRDSNILSCAILHDILEDCGDVVNVASLKDWGIQDRTIEAITKLTKVKGYDIKDYIDGILTNEISCIVKLADRLHNLGTMSGSFDVNKIEKYLKETKEEIIPIAKFARRTYPKNSSLVISLKREIERLMTTIEILFLEHGIDIKIDME